MIERLQWRVWKISALVAIALLIIVGWSQRHRFVPVDVGSRAPAYRAINLAGEEVSLAALRGKVVVLNVWATWCRPCVKEMPALERAYQELKAEGLEVVAVSVDQTDEPRAIQEFVDHFGITFQIWHDPARTVERRFNAIGLPTTFVIDRSGRITKKVLGAADWDDAEHISELRALLADKS